MLKNVSQLEFKIADKVYHFVCDQDSPLEHVKEALFQFQKYIGQIQDVVKQASDKAAADQAAVPAPASPEQQPEEPKAS